MKKFLCIFALSLVFCIISYAIKIEWRIHELRKSSPIADVNNAIARGDRRFIGIYGFTVLTPGLPQGRYSSIVKLHGLKTIEETGDFIVYNRQDVLQSAATDYAAKYNSILFRSLMSKPDEKTARLLKEIEMEMRYFESNDPLVDSLNDYKTKEFKFIYVIGIGIVGMKDREMDPIVYNAPHRLLKFNPFYLSDTESNRIKRITKNYLEFYNRNLYNLIKKSKLSSAK